MKALLDGIFVVSNVPVLAYGAGRLLPKSQSRLGLLGGLALVLVGAFGLVLTLFFPMDPRGSAMTLAGIDESLCGLLARVDGSHIPDRRHRGGEWKRDYGAARAVSYRFVPDLARGVRISIFQDPSTIRSLGHDAAVQGLRQKLPDLATVDRVMIGAPTRLARVTGKARATLGKLRRKGIGRKPIAIFDTYGPLPKTPEEAEKGEKRLNPGAAGILHTRATRLGSNVAAETLRCAMRKLYGPLADQDEVQSRLEEEVPTALRIDLLALEVYGAIQTTYIPLLQNLDETSRRSLHE